MSIGLNRLDNNFYGDNIDLFIQHETPEILSIDVWRHGANVDNGDECLHSIEINLTTGNVKIRY